ncbi:MAG: bile acid:sodium symporter family protein [Candidatus Thermoplasmatota archaeon]|jgi:BASS family bile acid:Na+ symporter
MADPGLASGIVTDVFLPLALAVIMFGMGMTLTPDDFRRVIRAPKAVAVGLAGHVLLVPLLAMGVVVAFHYLFHPPEAILLGLLLLASCPAGTTSNVVTYLARADAALSVSVTTVNSLAAVVTTPLLFLAMTRLLLGDADSIEVSVIQMVGLVLAIVVLPIVIGLLLRRARPRIAIAAERPFRIASSLLLVLVIAVAVYENRVGFWSLAGSAVPISLALNVLALAGGLWLGKLVGLKDFQARAVSIEAGFQNGTLGIALAVSQLDNAVAALVPGFYSLTMFVTGAAVAWWWARDTRRKEQVAGTAARRQPLAE